jgi:hypothetical protein
MYTDEEASPWANASVDWNAALNLTFTESWPANQVYVQPASTHFNRNFSDRKNPPFINLFQIRKPMLVKAFYLVSRWSNSRLERLHFSDKKIILICEMWSADYKLWIIHFKCVFFFTYFCSWKFWNVSLKIRNVQCKCRPSLVVNWKMMTIKKKLGVRFTNNIILTWLFDRHFSTLV